MVLPANYDIIFEKRRFIDYLLLCKNGDAFSPLREVFSLNNPSEQPGSGKPPRRGRKKKVAIILGGILAFVLLAAGIAAAGFYFYLDNQITEGEAGQLTSEVVTTTPELTDKVVHYLICGIDYDDDLEKRRQSIVRRMRALLDGQPPVSGNAKAKGRGRRR